MFKIPTTSSLVMNDRSPTVFHIQDIEDVDMWNMTFLDADVHLLPLSSQSQHFLQRDKKQPPGKYIEKVTFDRFHYIAVRCFFRV